MTATRLTRTVYVVNVNGDDVVTRTARPTAVALAEAFAAEDANHRVVVTAEPSGKVVYDYAYTAPAPVKRAKPFTRTTAIDPNVEVPAGYEAAYSRKRTGAVVFRALPGAEVTSTYLVAAYGRFTPAKDTTEARLITNALEAARLAAKRGTA